MQIELKLLQSQRRHHLRLRHPRPGRGAVDVGPDRRHARRSRRAARRSRHGLRRSRRRPSSPASSARTTSSAAPRDADRVRPATATAAPSSPGDRRPAWSAAPAAHRRRAAGGHRSDRRRPGPGVNGVPGTLAGVVAPRRRRSSSSSAPGDRELARRRPRAPGAEARSRAARVVPRGTRVARAPVPRHAGRPRAGRPGRGSGAGVTPTDHHRARAPTRTCAWLTTSSGSWPTARRRPAPPRAVAARLPRRGRPACRRLAFLAACGAAAPRARRPPPRAGGAAPRAAPAPPARRRRRRLDRGPGRELLQPLHLGRVRRPRPHEDASATSPSTSTTPTRRRSPKLEAAKGTSGYDMVVPDRASTSRRWWPRACSSRSTSSLIPNFKNLDAAVHQPAVGPRQQVHRSARTGARPAGSTTTRSSRRPITTWAGLHRRGAERGQRQDVGARRAARPLPASTSGPTASTGTPRTRATSTPCEDFIVNQLAPHIKAFDSYPGIDLAQGNYVLSQVFERRRPPGPAVSVERSRHATRGAFGAPTTELWMDNWCIVEGRARTSTPPTTSSTSSSTPENSVTDLEFHGYNTGVKDIAASCMPKDTKFLDMIFFTARAGRRRSSPVR